ncbi:hypothetical protein ABTZ59_18000 [Streptomyces sp. NPDC094034]
MTKSTEAATEATTEATPGTPTADRDVALAVPPAGRASVSLPSVPM